MPKRDCLNIATIPQVVNIKTNTITAITAKVLPSSRFFSSPALITQASIIFQTKKRKIIANIVGINMFIRPINIFTNSLKVDGGVVGIGYENKLTIGMTGLGF